MLRASPAARAALLLSALCCAGASRAATAPAGARPAPKLVVAISVDQYSAALFAQFRERYTRGLHRLADDGVVFPNAYQSHAATETCPGHSTILTGRHPAATGIVANDWWEYDPALGERKVYCVTDPSRVVPYRRGRGDPAHPRPEVSAKKQLGPAHLQATTLGDWLRAAQPAARVVAVAGKDRAAITLAGHDPTAVFWWDDDEYEFTTSVAKGASRADMERAIAPAARVNAQADRWAKRLPQWQPADARCERLNETRSYGAVTIEHRVPPRPQRDAARPAELRDDATFRAWVKASPELDRLTLELAGDLLDRYRLGRGPAPDLLAIGLSATDYIGHRFGTQGPEMCDQMAHLDRALGAFLARLDRLRVPYLVVLTADHGAHDAAERVAERGVPSTRISGSFVADLNAQLARTLALDYAPLVDDPSSPTTLYVDRARVTDPALRERVVRATLELVRARADVAGAWSDAELAAVVPRPDAPADELSLEERFAESRYAGRSPDVSIAFRPDVTLPAPRKATEYVAGHGSPWNYDRRVPILYYWRGATPFEQSLPVETVDIAPTLARLLGLPVPTVDGRCRDLLAGVDDLCR